MRPVKRGCSWQREGREWAGREKTVWLVWGTVPSTWGEGGAGSSCIDPTGTSTWLFHTGACCFNFGLARSDPPAFAVVDNILARLGAVQSCYAGSVPECIPAPHGCSQWLLKSLQRRGLNGGHSVRMSILPRLTLFYCTAASVRLRGPRGAF